MERWTGLEHYGIDYCNDFRQLINSQKGEGGGGRDGGVDQQGIWLSSHDYPSPSLPLPLFSSSSFSFLQDQTPVAEAPPTTAVPVHEQPTRSLSQNSLRRY